MNEYQKWFLIGIGVLMAVMLLFPPFYLTFRGQNLNAGYSFILNPPGMALVNTGMLLIQYLVVSAIGFIGWLLLKR